MRVHELSFNGVPIKAGDLAEGAEIGFESREPLNIVRYSIELPLKTVSALNVREHWAKRAKRVKAEREAAGWVVPPQFPLPCVVTLTRLSSGLLDKHDNLRSSFKGIVDGIADRLGIKDNDPRIKFRYAQEKVKRKDYGVRIELEAISC